LKPARKLSELDHMDALVAAARRLPDDRRDALRAALDSLADGKRSLSPNAARFLERLRLALGDERAEEAAREGHLVDKLAHAGELRPGFLLRALKEGRLGLFEAALARLGGFERDAVRRAVVSVDQPELLALACAAVGVDRGAFPTILEKVRAINGGRPGGGQEGADRAIMAFGPFPADRAGNAFRRVAGRV
jgi:uncharacterized protein (DUF2336 family)